MFANCSLISSSIKEVSVTLACEKEFNIAWVYTRKRTGEIVELSGSTEEKDFGISMKLLKLKNNFLFQVKPVT